MPNKQLTAGDAIATSRPFWWVMTALPFIAGYFTTGIVFNLPVVLGAVYFVFPYNLFIYGVNDIYDYESDLRNPRKNSLEGALLDRGKHRRLWRLIWGLNVPFWLYFMVIGDLRSTGWLLLMLFVGAGYSAKPFRFKESPFLDSITAAFRYVAPLLFGILLAGGNTYYWPAFLTLYLWAMANHAFGAIQDIQPDRAVGTSSIATRLGTTNTVLFCFFGYMVAAALPALIYGKEGIIPTFLLMPYVGLVARTLLTRNREGNPVFHRIWQLFTYLNYPLGALMAMYLLSLVKF